VREYVVPFNDARHDHQGEHEQRDGCGVDQCKQGEQYHNNFFHSDPAHLLEFFPSPNGNIRAALEF
jgi:hypothetical protein